MTTWIIQRATGAVGSAQPAVIDIDVTGAGHMVAGDRNAVFTDAVVEFLDRQSTV